MSYYSSLLPPLFLDAGHYVTGCSRDWISLRLVNEDETAEDSYDSDIGEPAPAPVVTTANVAASYGSSTSIYGLVALVLATTMM